MILKKIEFQGFKSFVDPTVLSFDSGVSAIVGPNGCGKSNISDSIRWVLGEQSAKALRGSKMIDVIFNGCASRGPLGTGEVTLTLDQVTFVRQHNQGVADGSIAVRMILGGVTDDVGDFGETTVIALVHRPEDAALNGLQSVRQIRDGAIANDVAGVFEKAGVDAAMERLLDLAGIERSMRVGQSGRHLFGDDFGMAVAVFRSRFALRLALADGSAFRRFQFLRGFGFFRLILFLLRHC